MTIFSGIEQFIDPDPIFAFPTCVFSWFVTFPESQRYESGDAKRTNKDAKRREERERERGASEQALSGLHTVETLLQYTYRPLGVTHGSQVC